MCVGFWSLEHPQYALILCSNRDEYLSRPTSTAHFHSFEQDGQDPLGEGRVLSGRDLLAGGTWAGISRTGRVAFLTNITEPAGKYPRSRGELPMTYLMSSSSTPTLQHEADEILARYAGARFAGFNLLLLAPTFHVDASGVRTLAFDGMFVTNSGGGGAISARGLSDEERVCGGQSNGIDRLGADQWPKVKHGTHAMNAILKSISEDTPESELTERLFELLTWKSEQAPLARSELRNTIEVEPLVVPETQHDGPPEFYGTRLSTVLLVRRDGSVLYVERDIWTLDPDGKVTRGDASKDRIFEFKIQAEDIVHD